MDVIPIEAELRELIDPNGDLEEEEWRDCLGRVVALSAKVYGSKGGRPRKLKRAVA